MEKYNIAEPKIIPIDTLDDKIQTIQEAYGTVSLKHLEQAHEEAEKNGRINDAEKYTPSSIMKRYTDCLKKYSKEQLGPDISVKISKTGLALNESIFNPAIKNGINECLEDLAYEKNDTLKEERLHQIRKIFEHLQQIAEIIEDMKEAG